MASYEKYRGRDKVTGKMTTLWRCRYRDGDGNGRSEAGFDKKETAEKWYANIDVSMQRGEYVNPQVGRTKIKDLGPKWVKAYETFKKKSGYRAVESAWRVHVEPRWGETSINAVRYSDVADWMATLQKGDLAKNRKPLGVKSLQRQFSVLSGILDMAVKDRMLTVNPIKDKGLFIKSPEYRQHRYLTHHEVETLWTACQDRDKTFVLFLAYTGLRYSEAAGLRVRHFDRLHKRVSVHENAVPVGGRSYVGTPKGGKSRPVGMPPFLVRAVEQQCKDKGPNDLIFPDPKGTHRPYSHPTTGWFNYAVKRSGLDRLTPHDLRHTAASLAVQSGANVKVVQNMLGHKSATETLDVYADLFPGDTESVAQNLDRAVEAEGCAFFVRFSA